MRPARLGENIRNQLLEPALDRIDQMRGPTLASEHAVVEASGTRRSCNSFGRVRSKMNAVTPRPIILAKMSTPTALNHSLCASIHSAEELQRQQ